jgi:RNA polymerase sigma-70 factor (ECF subfamily)
LAFEELVRPHLDSLRRFVFSLTSNWNDADDITQEALIKAFRSFGTFDGRAALSTWLYTVARSSAVDWHRSRMGKPRADVPLTLSLVDDVEGHDELLASKQGVDQLWGAIRKLDEKQRTALVLFDIEGLSYQEIAEIEGVPLGTVRSRLSRARAELQGLLQSGVTSVPPAASDEPPVRSAGGARG